MRSMSRFWTMLVVGMSLGIVLSWVSPARSVPLLEIDWNTFAGTWLGSTDSDYWEVIAEPMTRTFDFAPSPSLPPPYYGPGPDGEVTSFVVKGKGGPAKDLYVYVYQISHYSIPSPDNPLDGTSEVSIEGISFDLLGPIIPEIDGSETWAFQVIDTGVAKMEKATKAYNRVSFTIRTIKVGENEFHLGPGEETCLFGFLSPVPPTKTVADVKNTGNTVTSPQVYTPSPEPSAFVLLGVGLLGGIWWRKRLK